MDTIFIKGLLFWGKHGVYKEEHVQVQRFGVDIEIKQEVWDWDERLDRTYDYMEAREIARRCIEENSYKLIETLGEAIATEILLHPLAQSASVTIKKLDVIPPAEVGVVIVRSK